MVSAGAGFGKSRLLDQALADNRVRPAGLDVRVDLDVRLRSQSAFADAVMRAARLMPTGDVEHDLSRLVAWMVAQSPLDVCLVFDDVHEIDGSPAAELLAQLGEFLPSTAHLVLAGRDLTGWSTPSRRAGTDPLTIGEAELTFTPDEIDAIARSQGVDPERLAAFGGWPALTAAVALGRPAVAADFALEEVFDQLPPDAQRAVAALGVARRLPEAVLEQLVPSLSIDTIVARVPLLERRDGDVIGHDLWSGAARDAFDAEAAGELVAALVEHRRHDAAVEVAQRAERWRDADAATLALVAGRVHGIPLDLCRRLTHGVPDEHAGGAGHRLLCTIARSHEGDGGRSAQDGVAELLALVDELDDDGADEGALGAESLGTPEVVRTVLGVAVAFAWIARDPVTIDAVARRVADAGLDDDDWLSLVAQGFADIVHGRVADAERRLGQANDFRLPTEVRSLVMRVLVTLLGVSGDVEALRALDLEVLRSSPDSHVRQAPMVVAWLTGDVDGVAPWRTRVPDPDRHRSDQLTQSFFHAAVRASFGDTADLDTFAEGVAVESPDERGAIACRRALTAAIVHVGLGDEARAARLLREGAAGGGVGTAAGSDPLALQELARALCYPYLLAPELRPMLDALPYRLYRRHHAIARWLVELREGRVPDDPMPPPEQIFLAMPLAWSCELARRAVDAGADGGEELAHWLRTTVGPRAVEFLVDDTGGDGHADGLIGHAGSDDVRLSLLGPAHVEHASREIASAAAPEWRRLRVRQLLAVMALRRRIGRRELAEWLWPDRPPERAASNLRVTLSYARRAVGDTMVAPSRRVLVDRDGVLELIPHRRLSVDLWEHEAAVGEAARAEREGDIDAAAVALDRALTLWAGRPLADLDYDDRAAPDLAAVRSALCRSGTRCGELRLAHGDDKGAIDAAEAVLDLDPAWEPAHRLAIAVAVRSGDDAAKARALDRCRDALEGGGHHPGAEIVIARNLAAVDVASRAELPVSDRVEPRGLGDALDERWTHRVVEVVAPRSAGKSSAIVRARAAWERSDLHVDVALVGLVHDPAQAIAEAVADLDPMTAGAEGSDGAVVPTGSTVDALIAAVATRAPAQVCLIADGLDGIDALDRLVRIEGDAVTDRPGQPAPGGAGHVLARLVRDLPDNGHLLIAGRRPFGLRSARLELGGSLRRIDADALAFDTDEQATLIAAPARPLVAACFGWAGVVHAARSGGRDGALAALQNAFADLPAEFVAAAALAARIGGVDDAQLQASDLGVTIDDVVAESPVVRTVDRRLRAGPGAWEVLRDEILDPPPVARVNALAAELEERAGRPTRALAMLVDSDSRGPRDPGAVAALVARAHLAAVDPTSAEWARIVDALPDGHPATAVAAAAEAHHAGRAGDAAAGLERAVELGLDPSMAQAHSLHLAWCVGDTAALAEFADGPRSGLAVLADAALAAADGDHDGSLALIEGVVAGGTVAAAQARLQRRVSLAASGAASSGPPVAVLDLASLPATQWVAALAGWVAGDLESLAALLAAVDGDGTRIPAGCRALVAHASAALDPRPVTMATRVAAAGAGGADDPERSTWAPLRPMLDAMTQRRAALLDQLDRIDRLVIRDLTLDTSDGAIARRDGLIAALPIEHTLGVAGALVDRSPLAAVELLDRLATLAPAGFATAGETAAAAGSAAGAEPAETAIAAALHAHDRAVRAPVVVEFLGERPVLSHGGDVVIDGHWRRPMVRRLAALLAVGRRTREQVVVELWPDGTARSGLRSMRVALHYLRDALDPARPPGSSSLLVASAADGVALARAPGFEVDLWGIADALDTADAHRAAGRHGDAADAIRGAAGRWQEPGPEVLSLEPVARHVERLRARLVDALCGAGDTLVGLGDVDAAIEIGNEVVGLEPLGQHGYRLMIAAHVHAGRTVAARSILESCRRALAAADVALAPETEMLARVLENTAGHAGP